MAKKTSAGWSFATHPPERALKDYAEIFAYYAKSDSTSLSMESLMKLLRHQAETLCALSSQLQREQERREKLERQVAELKRDVTDLKRPPVIRLDKPRRGLDTDPQT